MNNPQKVITSDKPDTVISLGNGNYYYNHNIQSEVVKTLDMNDPTKEVEETRYSYILVRMNSKPSYAKCVEAVIRKYVTASEEFDYLNTAKRIELGLITGSEAEKELLKYKGYLALVDEIKEKVKQDFNS